ncbi:BatD family protein [Urechidicola croceus]|uniref:BatD protein n=1 Tax=Urechidicola croceus TaxID=1850246 RepID=A0A1D8P9Y5_9FLAO|nr:BatD family protein [Urechidicola croceus]AOW21301.1 BatD protein [Urechidicola croceus]
MSIKQVFISFFILFTTVSLSAQEIVELTTSVSKKELGINQRLKIEFSINKQGGDNFEPPKFENFEVIAGPSSSINQSWINGKASYSQAYIYIIKPNKVGTFIIPPATIEYEGKLIKSNTVQVTVLSESEVPKDPNDPSYIASQNVHLVAEVSDTNPYVGEGIYVVYKLYWSTKIGLGDWRVNDLPQFNGFWNQDIEVTNREAKNTTYKGEKYRSIVISRALLIPQKSGKLNIDPINADLTVHIPTGRGDFFGNAITHRMGYSVSSGKRTVNVKDLPINGKPENFTGAVGDFDFVLSASKDILRANETTQVNVKVLGKGNLKLFEIPKISTPSELEVYTPEHNENVRTTLSGLSGEISDSYTIVPQYKGKYKIPEVSFSYFDPEQEKYNTIIAKSLIVDVIEGKSLPSSSVDQVKINKQDVVLSANNFRYIQNKTKFEPMVRKDFFKSKLFYSLLLLPFLAIPIGIFLGKKKDERDSDIVGNRQRKADRMAKKYLSQAKKQLGKKEAFYIALEKALHNFLKAKLNIETTDISKEKITEILQERKVDSETIKEFVEVLNDCDFARYTPTTSTMMQQEYDKARVVITKIDKQI